MNIQQMMKQAQMMQHRMQEMQERMGEHEVTASSGDGMVSITMTCKGEVRKLTIAPDIINPSDKDTLEDLVMAAINQARQTADRAVADETRAMMAEFGMPDGVKLPF